MSNKLFLIILIGLLSFSLHAQKYRYRRNRQTSRQEQSGKNQKKDAPIPTPGSPAAKPAPAQNSAPPAASKFQKPALTRNFINYVMDNLIKKQLLERKIPTKLPGFDDSEEEVAEDGEKPEEGKKPDKKTLISRLDFSILMSQYQSLIDNFELTEVTYIRHAWYLQFQTELRKFGPIINEMTIAVRTRSKERYAVGMNRFKAHQKACLDFLKGKPPRISQEEHEALVLKNTRIRRQNYLKQIQEESGAQRRQEQQKNPAPAPAAAPAGK